MKMKKLTLAIAAIALCAAAAAQTTQEEFQTRYERLVRNLGYDGVGIETLLDRWEEAFPDDAAVPVARFNYYFYKGRRTEVVARPGLRRYLGQEPTLTLKDSDGNDVNYFEESFYDEDLFGEAMKILDAQIAAHPDELRWQYMRITALAAYEKESPDMAAAAPKVMPSSGLFGMTDPAVFGETIPVAGVAGDQQAALFGQCCYERGSVKNTYGTGGFLLMNTGDRPVLSKNGLLSTVAWQIGGKTTYALEGSVFICGAAIQWLRDGLGLVGYAGESEKIASSVENTGGVYFVPAFVGLGAPYWNPHVRGAAFGITRGTTRAHLVRAVLESMAFQTADLIGVMQSDSGTFIPSLAVDGGASANDLLLRMQADLLGKKIIRPGCVETTAMGAAFLAGLATGAVSSAADIVRERHIAAEFSPQISPAERQDRLDSWHRAVKAAAVFSE